MCAVLILVSVALAAAEAGAGGQGKGGQGGAAPFDWRDYARLDPSIWSGAIVVKIDEAASPQVEGGAIVRANGGVILDAAALLPAGSLRGVEQGFGFARGFLATLRRDGGQRCGCALADLSSYFTLSVDPAAVDLGPALALLNAFPFVEVAYPAADLRLLPPPGDIPPATPDYAGDQGYKDPAPAGISIAAAAAYPGGDGEGVTVIDMEIDWDWEHEDLDACRGGLVSLGTLYREDIQYTNHGTAVLGMLFGGDNGYGVTGMVPAAACRYVPDYTTDHGTDIPRALLGARERVPDFDVILLEAQTGGPNYDPDTYAGLVPVEWEPAIYDTIRTIVANGYTVVEAAGNGWEDLDGPDYNGRFDRGRYDSGAIVVGGGTTPRNPPARAPEWYTNWGRRLDVQGWGSNVYTTGYGDLFSGGGDPHQYYTAQFGGTSSASPVVTGAVAAIIGVNRAAGGDELEPRGIRDLLVATGTPQHGSGKHIGPLPDLRAALATLPICGNGEVNAGEACDDGNLVAGDGCSADCRSDETCGNGVRDAAAGEACDDGNVAAGDGCSADCRSDETCGNGVRDTAAGEACDDGNRTAGDGCSADCRSDETCGNGVRDTAKGEACDDGNRAGGDGCSSDCRSDETCGNGVPDVAAGEMCDDGNAAAGDGCSADCRSDETCGNGVRDAVRGEECDDGNVADDDGCNRACRFQGSRGLAGGCAVAAAAPPGAGGAAAALLCALLCIALVYRRRRGRMTPMKRIALIIPFLLAAACMGNLSKYGDGAGDDGADAAESPDRVEQADRADRAEPVEAGEDGAAPDAQEDADATADPPPVDARPDDAGAEDAREEELPCASPADCDDLNPCNGAESCDAASHACIPGTPPPDGFVCGADPRMICRSGACARSTCGDGFVDAGAGEFCEPPSTGACRSDCSWTCAGGSDCPDDGNPCDGEEYCREAEHRCDHRNVPADGIVCGDAPRSICLGGVCRESRCGDGFVDPGRAPVEECDDGDLVEGDGCDNDCAYSCHSLAECDDGRGCTADTCDTTGTHACVNSLQPSTFVCRRADGVCDVEERCPGTAPDCPADAARPSSHLCRAAAGVCDLAERCDGTSRSCPADAFAPTTEACDDGQSCTSPDRCDGAGACRGAPVPACCGFVAVDAGGFHSCGLTERGGVRCWGDNSGQQLGDGTYYDRSNPVQVQGLTAGVRAISLGRYHSCALTSAGGLRCWGYNSYGQLGDGTRSTRPSPVPVAGLSAGVAAIWSGGWHTCALLSAGGLLCWGQNGYGEIGDGSNEDRLTPAPVLGLASGVLGAAAGGAHTCAIVAGGAAKCWGYNEFGQVGNGDTANMFIPVDVSGLASGVARLSLARYHSCALTSAGGVRCWGGNQDGQLGNGTTDGSLSPVGVWGLSSGVAAISAAEYYFTCAILASGAVRCWGDNGSGQLGNGTNGPTLTPVDVVGLTAASSVSGGAAHACAAVDPARTFCWGGNQDGQLGNGTNAGSNTPVRVLCP